MRTVTYVCRSKKYSGLLIGFLQLADGTLIRLSGKPEGGERIESKARRIKNRMKGGDLSLPR